MGRHYQLVALTREVWIALHLALAHGLLKGLGSPPVVARCWELTVPNFWTGDPAGEKRRAKT